MALKVLTQCRDQPTRIYRVPATAFLIFFFLMFLKSSLLYKKMIDTLEMGGWLLGTAFSGHHQQARARKEWVSQQRSSRQNPWSQGTAFKRKLSKNVPKERRNGKPGTCLCNHELDSRLLTLHLQLSSTFSSACSYLISSRSEEIYSVIPNASSSLLFFCDSANIPVPSCKAPTAGSPGTPGSRFPCKWMPYLCSSPRFCPVRSRSHTHSGTGQGGCGRFQKHKCLEESTRQYLGKGGKGGEIKLFFC